MDERRIPTRRLRPDLDEPKVVTVALGLIHRLESMRYFRTFSDAASEARMRAVLERQLETLRGLTSQILVTRNGVPPGKV